MCVCVYVWMCMHIAIEFASSNSIEEKKTSPNIAKGDVFRTRRKWKKRTEREKKNTISRTEQHGKRIFIVVVAFSVTQIEFE